MNWLEQHFQNEVTPFKRLSDIQKLTILKDRLHKFKLDMKYRRQHQKELIGQIEHLESNIRSYKVQIGGVLESDNQN